jgi:hypothetical protein
MSYQCTFLNNIHGISFNSEELLLLKEHGLKINNDEAFLENFYSPETINIVGLAIYNTSKKLKAYIHTEFSVKLSFNPDEVLSYLLKTCSILSNALWLVKDNSVRFNVGHLKYTDNLLLTVTSNFVNSLYTTCIAEKNVTKFSKEEMIQAISYFNFFFMLDLHLEEEKVTHAETNRITRAFYFLDLARKNFDIGTKVALHCSALECLFSVSSAELRHRLSETIANYLGTDLQSKRKLYDEVKAIYDFRSSVTHGSGIPEKLLKNNAEKLSQLGISCDNIVRYCFVKIINDTEIKKIYDENDNDKLSNFLTDLNFR